MHSFPGWCLGAVWFSDPHGIQLVYIERRGGDRPTFTLLTIGHIKNFFVCETGREEGKEGRGAHRSNQVKSIEIQ